MRESLRGFKEFDHVTDDDLQVMNSRGLAHDHVRIAGTDWMLRIPRGNQLGMDDVDYLEAQQKIYDAMAVSGVTPRALGIVAPDENLPHGAIVVQYIEGCHIRRINDMKAVAKSLGRLHKTTSGTQGRNDLPVADAPLASQTFLLREIFKDSFNSAAAGKDVRSILRAERDHVLGRVDDMGKEDLALSIIGGDSHPGNYLIDKDGKAWLVDLEFAQYDVPLVDLADAALPITAKLDPGIHITPDFNSRRTFYHGWSMIVGKDIAEPLRAHVGTAERAVRLRTLAWLMNWETRGRYEQNDNIDSKTCKNWDDMAGHYLKPDTLSHMFLPKDERRPS